MSLQYNVGMGDYGVQVIKVTTPKSVLEVELLDLYRADVDINSLYIECNNYLATLPKEITEEINNIILEVDNFNETNNYSSVESVRWLEDKVKVVVDLLSLPNWRTWFFEKARPIPIPETVFDTFKWDPDMGITEDKTYVTSEYIALASIIIFIRLCTPLYAEYYRYVRKNTRHPHYSMLRLFYSSTVNEDDMELDKLRRYIDANFESMKMSAKSDNLIIAAGLSDDDITDYLLAEIVFNKLLPMDAYTLNKDGNVRNIVSYAFSTIRHKGPFRGSSSKRLRATASAKSSERDDYSYFEDYRKTTVVPIGTIVELQHALDDPANLITALGLTNFDFKFYNNELKHIRELTDRPIDNVQLYLLGWYLSPIVNPRALFYLERRKISELRLFVKTALINTDQSYIGIFIGSHKVPEEQSVNVMLRNTINRGIFDSVRDQYKWILRDDKPSTVEETISETARTIVNYVWKPVGSLGKVKGLVTEEGFLDTPNNINDLVTSYVAFVTNR